MKWPASIEVPDTRAERRPTMDHIGIDLGSRDSQVCVRNGAGETICTHASEDYKQTLDAYGITCSMSRRGV